MLCVGQTIKISKLYSFIEFESQVCVCAACMLQDLVKSHLMFAVHEEVELLKEQIKELMVKNSQLEYENGILRANATAETLAQLEANPAPVAALVSFSTDAGPSAPS